MEHTENIKTILSQLRYWYPGYLFEIEEYPSMMMVWVRSKSSGLENKKAILKCADISLVKYEIEKMVNDIEEENLKSVVGWSNKYTVTPKELIFQDKKTTVINWTDNTKTIVKCSDDDVFSPEAGVALCYMKKFVTDNDSERFHRLLKSLVSNSKSKNSKKENKRSGLATLIKEAVNIIYALEENHDIDTGTSDNSGDNDSDGSAVEVES